ncbi:AIR synthase-related protein [Halopseudomonas pachastrellae]|nr:AIR synthase-related protein [Halopseudomonas pachastrellae]
MSELLMAPTRIYVKALLQLIKQTGAVKAMAHITGGGLLKTFRAYCPRALRPSSTLKAGSVRQFSTGCKEQGNVDETEMHRVLNCGVGMVICVAASKPTPPCKPARRWRATLGDWTDQQRS